MKHIALLLIAGFSAIAQSLPPTCEIGNTFTVGVGDARNTYGCISPSVWRLFTGRLVEWHGSSTLDTDSGANGIKVSTPLKSIGHAGVASLDKSGQVPGFSAVITLPPNFTPVGGVDVVLKMLNADGVAGNVRLEAKLACVAESADVTSPSFNAAQTNTYAVPGAIGTSKKVTMRQLSMSTSCVPDARMVVHFGRLYGDALDTYTGDLNITDWYVVAHTAE